MQNPRVDRDGDKFVVWMQSERGDMDSRIVLTWGQASALDTAIGQAMLDWDIEHNPAGVMAEAFS